MPNLHTLTQYLLPKQALTRLPGLALVLKAVRSPNGRSVASFSSIR